MIRQTWGTENYMDFLYDENGTPYSFIYNGTQYYYVKNLQGDVVKIVNTSGSVVGSYSYDAWGKVTASGSIGQINPIRYRGYYYNIDTGFYYLQSRYYDPTVKRFISADGYISTGQGFLGFNMYAYCLNNPIIMVDYSGSDDLAFLAFAIKATIITIGFAVLCYAVTSPEAQDFYSSIYINVANGFDNFKSNWENTLTDLGNGILAILSAISQKPSYRSNQELYHIVAQKSKKALISQAILDDVGIKINSDSNTIWLKTGLHRRLHTNAYHLYVEFMIISAYLSAPPRDKIQQKENVQAALETIKKQLKSIDNQVPF